jgi:predicted esterase
MKRRVSLVGFEQGGAVAMVLGAVWPELFDRIISICGFWPRVHGWEAPQLPMNGLPVTLLQDPRQGPVTRQLIEDAAAEITKRGGRANIVWATGAATLEGCALLGEVRRALCS